MNSILNQFKEEHDVPDLGNFITSWKYTPTRSNKFLFSALGVIGALVIFAVYYGEHFLPWIRKIPVAFLYIALFILSPVLKYITGMGKDQEWTLFKNGYKQKIIQRNKILEERTGWWKNYKTCSYDAKGVRLIPNSPLQRATRIYAPQNKIEVYSICRERISLAQAQEIESRQRQGKQSLSPQQQYLQRIEQRKARQKSARG